MQVDATETSAGASFFGFLGVAFALGFASNALTHARPLLTRSLLRFSLDIGAAYGTSKSGIGIATMGVLKPDLIMKNIVPVVMAGILGIYGLIVSVILLGKIDANSYTYQQGFKHLSAGICCGFSSLVSAVICDRGRLLGTRSESLVMPERAQTRKRGNCLWG